MTEKELIQGCIRQDRRSQNALYKLYFPLMSSIAIRYSNSEEEAIQHINYGFLKVLRSIGTYRSEFAFATWIRNILINHIIDENRKNKWYISNMEISDDIADQHQSDYNSGERNLEAKELYNMLKKLPEASRKVFTLFAIDGFKHREIAEMLGITEGTSKWHVNEARRRLAELLEQEKKTITPNKVSV